jgi:hypothetical protein
MLVNPVASPPRLAFLLSLRLLVVLAILVWSPTAAANPPQVLVPIYVNATATGLNNGTSWTDAYTSLDVALAAVAPTQQIWCAQSKYVPANHASGFQVPANVKLFGAFLGSESSVAGRQGTAARTILYGEYSSGQNVEHVVTIASLWPASGNPGVVIDGFTIQAGNATPTNQNGGGILCQNTSLDLVGCTVYDNSAANGGGLYFEEGLQGDGVDNVLHLKQTDFTSNFAVHKGGGVFGEYLNGEIVNGQFLTNEALEQGGGVYLWKMGTSDADLLNFTNCAFWGNWVYDGTAMHFGGAVKLDQASSVDADVSNAKFVNCTFSDNYTNNCADGQAVFVTGNSRAKIYNSILAFNNNYLCPTNQPVNGDHVAVTMEYSDIWVPANQLPWGGSGNIKVDPLFRRHEGGFLTLIGQPQGQPGSSLCIDAADHGRLPTDVLDIDNDGDTGELLPVDLHQTNRFVNRWEADSGAPVLAAYLDINAIN